MRDGTVLRASVVRPADRARHPTLVFRTPYNVERALAFSPIFMKAARRGYAVVAQDVRGRFASEGEFEPYRHEGQDGHDTIEWAAAAPWSDGQVGTFGLSYPGAVQWLAAVESPPHLRAMVPAMTFSRPDAFWYAGGLPDLSWITWAWLYIAPEERRRRALAGPRSVAEAEALWPEVGPRLLSRYPLSDVPELAEVAPWYLEWLRHPPDDPWWAWSDLSGRYDRVHAAVLNISGWHDEHYGAFGALNNHLGLLSARAGKTDPGSWLVLGPWVHGIAPPSEPEREERAGERRFGPAARLRLDDTVLSFMDRHLRGMDIGDTAPPVSAFIMGENRWVHGQRWPIPTTRSRRWHLGLDGTGGGTLSTRAPRVDGALALYCDPANPLTDPYGDALGAHDYRDLHQAPGTLSFETAPLRRDIRVLGRIGARLHIMTDAPSIDIWLKLLDVAPDGTAWNLMSPGPDAQRVDLGRGAPRANEVIRVELDRLLTGNRFARGHRIRIVIATSFVPHFARNPQTGERECDTAATRPASLQVLVGPHHSSWLRVPVLEPRDELR